jgi:uncharacterized RDD family membrane protein YckC
MQQQRHTPPVRPNEPQWGPAPLSRRFGGLMIDWLLCLLASGLFANPRLQPWAPVAVLVAEYTFFVGFFGQTPGMFVVRIRCVRYPDGGPLGVARAFVRGLLLALLVPALIMDRDQRGLHDRAVGSIMVSQRA